MFDVVVSSLFVPVLDDEIFTEVPIPSFMPTYSKAELQVVTFLDLYFKGKSVENAPDAKGPNTGCKFMRLRWKELYLQCYLPVMETLKCVVDYNEFKSIRKKYRPLYKRSRKVIKIFPLYVWLLTIELFICRNLE